MLEIKTDNSYLHCKFIPLLSFCCLLCFAYPIMVANNVFGRNGIFVDLFSSEKCQDSQTEVRVTVTKKSVCNTESFFQGKEIHTAKTKKYMYANSKYLLFVLISSKAILYCTTTKIRYIRHSLRCSRNLGENRLQNCDASQDALKLLQDSPFEPLHAQLSEYV